MRNGFEWFRLITPILVTICLFFAQDIRANVVKIEERLYQMEQRLTRVETKVDYLNGERALRKELP